MLRLSVHHDYDQSQMLVSTWRMVNWLDLASPK
jgi:hypothetical protein